ncbi:cryptococcal mannosyltransferase 1-domain-containing protein [Talaromyces proteolyticus]|uniref:Cryptococcal mannosyltransferase 1-domain-containing protein n=1 Tax=Talaromyces proteolyticus TaxID=1131652 RepID=A0AAD4PX51_9EURO|nr:cryptococcal mannosyltransferase 1-domain-containing protein [Talaromyces proteolyticus]KAH8693137.1 cryptococcal mannosyltransferase 1-domain-containing protein [Talaromyces proteolyticus]
MPILNPRIRRHLVRIFIFILFLFVLDASFLHYRSSPSKDPALRSQSAQAYTATKQTPQSQRIFIASTHWNNEIVLRSHWNAAVIQLAASLGPENVYVSIVESGSYDNTKGALLELDYYLGQLKINRTISLSEATHQDAIMREPEEGEKGWIETPRGRKELRRIPFLSRERNESLKPLALLEREIGLRFDKILFLNDINDDFFTLLDTNQGSYAAACALDFSKPPAFYDTFALRDSEGHEAMMQTWPYFRADESRHALERGDIVPVKSCWNSMVIMDATPFYDTVSPLRFRGISDSLAMQHLEGSECCLIHADNPLSGKKGVWLNPNVRVAYNGKAYDTVHPANEREWITSWQKLIGRWESRIRRWVTSDVVKFRTVFHRLRNWQKEKPGEKRVEAGDFCLIDEMHIIVSIGWAHV